MKSLEIVDLRVERLNNKPEIELVENDEMLMISNEDMGYAGILTLSQLQQIKEDLEVLEIFNKLLGNMNIDISVDAVSHREKGIIYYPNTDFKLKAEDRRATIKELLKLKQWLEENENDSQDGTDI